MPIAMRWVLLAALMAAVPSCVQILGMEEPTLDRSNQGGSGGDNHGGSGGDNQGGNASTGGCVVDGEPGPCNQCVQDLCCLQYQTCNNDSYCRNSLACCLANDMGCCDSEYLPMIEVISCVNGACGHACII